MTASTPSPGSTARGQLGTFSSRRSAHRTASAFAESGDIGSDLGTVGALVDSWVAGRVHVSAKSRMEYEWAAGHIRRDLGAVRVDRLGREDVARWLEGLAAGGHFARRSIVILRTVLRAALADAVAAGELRRSPADRVGMPGVVAKPDRDDQIKAWTEEEAQQFLRSIAGHRWSGPIRLTLLYGLRRSELLGLSWSAVDLKKGTLRIERGLTEVHVTSGVVGGQERPLPPHVLDDPSTMNALGAHRRFQAEERLAAGAKWEDNNLVVASRTGTPVSPGNLDRTLERLVAKAGVPRLTSHGLRHTAATHMVRHAEDPSTSTTSPPPSTARTTPAAVRYAGLPGAQRRDRPVGERHRSPAATLPTPIGSRGARLARPRAVAAEARVCSLSARPPRPWGFRARTPDRMVFTPVARLLRRR